MAAALWSDELLQVSRLEVRFIEGGIEQTRRQRGRAPREVWRRVKQLGQGGFATVYLERSDTSEATLRAVKQLRKAVGPGKIDYRRELEAAALFSHEKYRDAFVRSFGWYETNDHVYLTMEYFALGDFSKHIGRCFPEPEARSVVQQILTALEFMHERDFVHRDLKPANLLVRQAGPDWWIKVTDFGISKRATAGDTTLRTHAYTEQYAAPEVRIGEGSYTRAVDMWSTGVITYNLLTARATPLSSAELWRYYHQSESFPTQRLIGLGVGEAASQFLAELLSSVPEKRPTAKECLQHEWLGAADVHDDGPSEDSVVQEVLPEMNPLTMISEGEQYARWTTQRSDNAQKDTSIAATVQQNPSRTRREDQPRSSDKNLIPKRPMNPHRRQDKRRVETWSTMRVIEHSMEIPSYVRSVAFSPDGTRLASGLEDGTVWLWIAATATLLAKLKGHMYAVCSLGFSPDGTRLVSASEDRTIRLWDVLLGEPLMTIEGHKDRVRSVAFSPDGTRLLSGSGDKTVRLWDAATGALLQTLEGHSSWVTSVAFSPDGTRLASGYLDQNVRLWNAATGALLRTLKGHTDWVWSVAFSPDSTQIASTSADTTIRLWDAATGALLQTLEGHLDSVRSVAFSPDGTRLASGSSDQTARLWNAATGALLRTLEGHRHRVSSVAFSSDSTQLASASGDGTVRLWARDTAYEL